MSADQVYDVGNRLVEFCENHKAIYLYGAGDRGTRLCQCLRLDNRVNLQGFVVTVGTVHTVQGLPVVPVADADFGENCGVVIAFEGADFADIQERVGGRADIFCFPDEMFAILLQRLCIENAVKDFNLRQTDMIPEKSAWKDILIIRLDVIGDLVMTTPFLREIRNNCPESHITLVVNKQNEMLFRYCPYISEMILYAPDCTEASGLEDNDISSLKDKVKKYVHGYMQNRHYDIAFLPRQFLAGRYAIEEFLLLCAVGAESTVCRVNNHSQESLIWNIFSKIYCERGEQHEVRYMLDMLASCGCTVENDNMELWTSQREKTFAKRILKSFQYPCRIAVGLVGRDLPKKNWPENKYQEFINRLIDRLGNKISFILFGGDEASPTAKAILQGCCDHGKQILDLTGKTDLAQSVAVMQECHLYVGAETGVKHLAAAVRLPVVELSYSLPDSTINNESDPRRFGAWGVPRIVLRPQKGLDDCKKCCRKNYPHCITQIPVEEVVQAAEKLLCDVVHIDLQ